MNDRDVDVDAMDESKKIFNKILGNMHFSVNENDTSNVYVEYKTLDDTYEFRSVKDSKFLVFVRIMYRDMMRCDEVPPFHGILQKYVDQALYDESKVKILSRMGGTANETAYFMADKKNRVILINENGYKNYKRVTKYKFLKMSNTMEQVFPQTRGGLLEELSPFLNMDSDMKILFAVNLVQEFICTSSHYLCVISSPQGSGKSTFTNMWRRIVDPAVAVITTMPDNAEALKNHLANNLMVCFDNTQQLNATYSDILCGAVTGTSYTRRKLYTDNAEIVMKLHNIVILNGIDVIPQKSDLLERSLLFRLNKIPAQARKNEEELEKSFKETLPYIMGAIFKTLSEYFRIKDTTKIIGSHRMAGAYKDCFVIAKVLGVEKEFLEVFKKNQIAMQADYMETNPLISAVISYMDDIGQKEKRGSVSELYDEIREYADKSLFPKSPAAFSRELNAQKSALEGAGYICSITKGRMYSTLYIHEAKEKK